MAGTSHDLSSIVKVIPQALKQLPQWILWSNENGNKTPYQTNGQYASTTNPGTWLPLEQAAAGYNAWSHTGLGFVFTEDDGLCGIDLDNCRNPQTSVIDDWALIVIDRCQSYCEVSPSQRGVKIWVRGGIPAGKGFSWKLDDAAGIEVYQQARYFTVTGQKLPQSADEPRQAQEMLNKLVQQHAEAVSKKVVQPAIRPVTGAIGHDDSRKLTRAEAYVRSVPHPVCGSGTCESSLFTLACTLARGFDLPEPVAADLLWSWMQNCDHMANNPGKWTCKTADRAVRNAAVKADGETIGGRLLEEWPLGSIDGNSNQDSMVDLTKILEGNSSVAVITEEGDQQPEDDDQQEPEPGDPGGFPEICLRPPGLLSDIIDFNLATAICKQPVFAVAGALALLSMLTGRKIRWNAMHTNLYLVCLGKTGSGKDHARAINKKIMSVPQIAQLPGSPGGRLQDGFGSHAGIRHALKAHPVNLFQSDEIGDFLKIVADSAGKSGWMKEILSMLKELYTSSSHSVWSPKCTGKEDQNFSISYPHVSLLGTGVAKPFWASLTSESVHDGFLGRCIILSGDDDPDLDLESFKTANQTLNEGPPAQLLADLAAWASYRGYSPAGTSTGTPAGNSAGNLAQLNPVPRELEISEEAWERFCSHVRASWVKRPSDPEFAHSLWVRASDRTSTLAQLFAVSRCRHPDLAKIEIEDMEIAIAMTNYSIRSMLCRFSEHVAENPYEKDQKRILKYLKDRAGKWVTTTSIARKTQDMRAKERNECLAHLLEMKRVEVKDGRAGINSNKKMSLWKFLP